MKQKTKRWLALDDATPADWDSIQQLRGNSLKYRWRYPYKNGTEDLRKAAWYEERLLNTLENKNG